MVTRSGDQNLLVLALYLIGISYTFNRMIESIDDKIKYEYKKAIVDEHLQEQNLLDKIGVSFKFAVSNDIDEVKELSLSIENKSDNLAIYVDWDNSSIVGDLSKQSRRVIRKSPDMIRDLAVPQSPSLIAPKSTLSETVTAEDVLQRDQESEIYKAINPLLAITKLKSAGPPQKKMYNEFMTGKQTFEFSLQLVLRISEVRVGLSPGVNIPPMCILNCPFTVRKLPWTHALPWNKKK
jgi:hypothetical protein